MNNGYMNSSHKFFRFYFYCWFGGVGEARFFFLSLFRYCIKEMMCDDLCVCVYNLVNDDIEPISIFFSLRHLKYTILRILFSCYIVFYYMYVVHEMLFFFSSNFISSTHGLDNGTNNVTRIIRSFLMGTENDFI